MRAVIQKSKAFGHIIASPSKSYAHRLLISAALSYGKCKISNVSFSNDILATINCLKTLGRKITIKEDSVLIENNPNIQLEDTLIFDCIESGSTLRFFIPIALTTGKKAIFRGSKKLLERGILPYEKICEEQNIIVEKHEECIIFDGNLKPNTFYIPGNISSQFISGLLFTLPLLNGDSKIIITTEVESKNYIDITLDVLNKAGIQVVSNDKEYFIKGNQQYQQFDYDVEGDYSNVAFIDAYNYFDGEVVIEGLNQSSYQGDKKYKEYFELLSKSYTKIDIANTIDLGPILFAFASLKHGGHFTGVSRLKIKESNRINDMALELAKFGVYLTEINNDVVINNQNIHAPNEILDGHNDHRIVMALTLMATTYGGTIDGCEAVNKSYPDYFEKIKSLGIEVEIHDK